MILKLGEISKTLSTIKSLGLGCIVDTNVMFAATVPQDSHNEWAEKVFQELQQLDIPVFTNINIRSEFIELNRRVLISEGLLEFYEDFSGSLNFEIEHKLKSLKSSSVKAIKEGKVYKVSDADTKKYRTLLGRIHISSNTNGWNYFCENYLHPYITPVWDDAIDNLKIQFLGTREIERKEYFNDDPKWTDMVDIVGRTGIGTSDAMIINLFLKSKLSLIVTADADVRDSVATMMPKNKFILAPH